MADIIRLLPDHVANQIAAGEVIQRPASVVKELLENAIDAKATKIQLIIGNAGKGLIQVIDNGIGMSDTDARMCLERHATSKITNADDLFGITTKGFRGEAMASIAAIAHVEIRSKRQDDKIGVQLLVEGSELKEQGQCQCPVGTSISVKNLFFNVPARRKFLKRDPVEMKHILDEFQRVALVHTDIHFTLHHNNEEITDLKPCNLRQRTVDVFGRKYDEKLVPISEQTTIARLQGFVGKPEFAKKTRGDQYFFVNGRFVRSGYMHHAVSSAYEDLVKEKSYPAYFIHIDVDPAFIDINIHPTKTEVKFEDERAIYAIIRSSVRQSLGKYNIAPALDFDQETSFGSGKPQSDLTVVQPKVEPMGGRLQMPDLGTLSIEPNRPDRTAIDAWQRLNEKLDGAVSVEQTLSFETPADTTGIQILGKYIVTEIDRTMMLIDQGRAHERVLYEKLIKHLAMDRMPAQQQLFPLQVELSPQDAGLLKQYLNDLRRLGIGLEDAGNNTFIVRSLAEFISSSQLKETIEEMLDGIKNGADLTSLKRMDHLARKLAQRSARRNRKMTTDEIKWLINELLLCNTANRTPTGLPIMVEFSSDRLDKLFSR